MGDPLFHSQSSAKTFGGLPEDYLNIHTIMDSSKLFLADWRHRALLHNTFGIHIFEQFLGPAFNRKSDGKAVCTRTVISQHIMEDLKAIPTPGEFLREMPLKRWMAGMTDTHKSVMQSLTIEGDANREAYINSNILWYFCDNKLPPLDGIYLVASKEEKLGFCAKYVASSKEWFNTADDKLTSIEYWAYMPISPCSPN